MDGLEACWTVRTNVEMGNLLIYRWMERTSRRTGQRALYTEESWSTAGHLYKHIRPIVSVAVYDIVSVEVNLLIFSLIQSTFVDVVAKYTQSQKIIFILCFLSVFLFFFFKSFFGNKCIFLTDYFKARMFFPVVSSIFTFNFINSKQHLWNKHQGSSTHILGGFLSIYLIRQLRDRK